MDNVKPSKMDEITARLKTARSCGTSEEPTTAKPQEAKTSITKRTHATKADVIAAPKINSYIIILEEEAKCYPCIDLWKIEKPYSYHHAHRLGCMDSIEKSVPSLSKIQINLLNEDNSWWVGATPYKLKGIIEKVLKVPECLQRRIANIFLDYETAFEVWQHENSYSGESISNRKNFYSGAFGRHARHDSLIPVIHEFAQREELSNEVVLTISNCRMGKVGLFTNLSINDGILSSLISSRLDRIFTGQDGYLRNFEFYMARFTDQINHNKKQDRSRCSQSLNIFATKS